MFHSLQQPIVTFASIVENNKGIIYKVANTYCKDTEDRKDLVQEIIVQLWLSHPRYDKRYKLSTWIYRIALNVSISFYRKENRRKEIAKPLSGQFIQLPAIEMTMPEQDKNLILLQQFISELKELDRALILLYLENKPHREIADILGLSESNIATKIGRIKEKLRLKFANIT